MTTQIETVVEIELDVFPARVRLSHGGTVEPVRALIAEGDLVVWSASGGGPHEVHRSKVLSYEGGRSSGYSVLTDQGQVVVTRAGGCGCGNALKSFNPFPGRRRVAVTRG